MLSFEAALAEACAAYGFIPTESASEIVAACAGLQPDLEELKAATARDGVVVPELIRQLRDSLSEASRRHVHFGATSQDVIDTSLMVRLKQVSAMFDFRLATLISGFEALSAANGDAAFMAHTRMQPALAITARDRIEAWRGPLLRHAERLQLILDRGFALQLGGPVGTLGSFGSRAGDVRMYVACKLALTNTLQYQSQRDRLIELSGLLAMITGSLGKFGQDVALLAQDGREILLSGGGGSSAMAHKQNPVSAEVLVSLARFNAVQAGGMQQAMVHEQERSGAAWTLEWLVLPPMVIATGAALRLAGDLLGKIRPRMAREPALDLAGEEQEMREGMMKKLLMAALVFGLVGTSAFADTIKIGVIGPFSGPFALQGKNFKAGIDAWLAVNGKSVGGNEIDVVYRDVPQADPAKSKALAQELVVREKVQYLAGFYFTPDAMAATPLLQQANVPMVVMNAATSAIVTTSPYVVRTSFTTWQTTTPIAAVAKDAGITKVITLVSDYGPGIDAETAFKTAFEKNGGKVVEAIRMPLSTNDFSPLMQRVKDSGAEALFTFLPSGPPTLAFVKAYNDNGLKAAGVKFFATGDLTQESDLPALGQQAEGLLTTFHYAVAHDSPENKAFVEAARKAIGNPAELSFPAVGAYDGMYVISKMIEATGGKQDAAKAVEAVKGLTWTSPRGPVTIDPESRHMTQTIYLREVAKDGDHYINKEIRSFDKQGDPEGRLTMQSVLSVAIDALAYGMVLFVISIGLSITMGLMRVVNLAHGAFAMIGGYLASFAARDLGLGYAVGLLVAIVGTILIAIPLERFLYRRIYGAPELTQVLMTIGITFCIIGIANFVFGPTLKTIPLPESLRGATDVGFRSIATHRIFAIVVGIVIAALLWLLIEKTAFGVRLRATVDNAAMAAALGVRTEIVYAASFSIAVGLAALGGAIGFVLFPDNLALLTRITATALLVLSLDLVTGYCGVATLGHAALFGAGAYGAGIAAVHLGITDPLLMTLIGAASGGLAGLVCGARDAGRWRRGLSLRRADRNRAPYAFRGCRLGSQSFPLVGYGWGAPGLGRAFRPARAFRRWRFGRQNLEEKGHMTPILEIRHLTKSFGGLQVSRNVSLSLASGERVALIGPNGAGKTTFINLVTGGLRPDSGQVLLDGKDVTSAKPAEKVRRGLVRSFQVTRLFKDMTPQEHIAAAVLQREGKGGRMFGHYADMPEVCDEIDETLRLLHLQDVGEVKVSEIAYGQQRLLELAMALALRPRVLLLDEPAAGIPHAQLDRIQTALDRLPPELAVLMIDHDMDLVFRFAKRVVVLAAGLGYVPQTRDVFPSLSVEENLLVGLKNRPKDAISEAYEMFPRLKERRRNLGSQLSGGEQQMLSTARSILGQPSVLLLDEPLEGLAPVICEELMAALTQLADSRTVTIILVEQRIQSALDFADKAIVLERGRLVWQGDPAVLAGDRDLIERMLGVNPV
eukprot:g3872.t1